MKKFTITLIQLIREAKKLIGVALFATFFTHGANAQEVKFNNEAADTTRITSILIDECTHPDRGNVERIARLFINTPYATGTLDRDSVETLTENLDSLDCTTFVENVLALAYTAGERRQSWHDFTYNLRRMRYRGGTTDGYASRLHYISDWIVDNVSRGNLREITSEIPKVRYGVKSLDFMSTHRDKYPALADESNYRAIKNVEAGFSNHRFPYIKGNSVKSKNILSALRNGDIICFTTNIKGLDVTHLGIVTIIDGMPHIIHASSRAGKVIVDPLTLPDYIHRNRTDGIRVVRLRIE